MKKIIRPKRCYKPMGLAIKSKTITCQIFKDVVDKVKEAEHPFFVLYFENLYLLAYETGGRISEILPIHETDLDLRYGIVHYVVRKKLKKPMETSKHLTPELLDRLREHVKQYRFQIDQSGGYVFFGMASKEGPLTIRTAERHFELARDAAGHGSLYGQSRPLYKITNLTNEPQQLNIFGRILKDGKEIEVVTKKISVLPHEHIIRCLDIERYKNDKRFKIEFAYAKKLRRCTVHSLRHLSGQTVMEEKGLFEAFDHLDHVSITSTMAYLDANPKKRQTRAEVFRGIYGESVESKAKVTHAIREETPQTMDISNMAQIFSQMAEFLSTMQGKSKDEKFSDEFNAVMRIKAEQEHKNAFAPSSTQ